MQVDKQTDRQTNKQTNKLNTSPSLCEAINNVNQSYNVKLEVLSVSSTRVKLIKVSVMVWRSVIIC